MRAAREEGVDRAAAVDEAMAEGILDLLLAAYRSIEIGEGPIINITVMGTDGYGDGPGSGSTSWVDAIGPTGHASSDASVRVDVRAESSLRVSQVSRVGCGGGGFRGPGEELQDAGPGGHGSYSAHSDVRAAQCSDGMRAGYGGNVPFHGAGML
jgi:hypothetical protein